ncbi:MAG: serine O-acetyltransferase [Bdellovibrio sp.]
MFELVKAYQSYDPAAKSFLEVLLLYPGPKAIFFHRISHFLYTNHFFFMARLVSEISRLLTGIEIHPGAQLGRRLVIDHGMGLVIGETARVGDDCILFHGVTLGGLRFIQGPRHPHLGDRVVVGAGAKILGAIRIGDGARVGANSVVLSDLDPGKTHVGFPRQASIDPGLGQ